MENDVIEQVESEHVGSVAARSAQAHGRENLVIDSHNALPQHRHGAQPDRRAIWRGHSRVGHGQKKTTRRTRLGGDAGNETDEEEEHAQTAHG